MQRISNTIAQVLDQYTGDLVIYNKVTNYDSGAVMTDLLTDGVIFRKLGTEYFKRQTDGYLDVRWWGAKGDNVTDNTTALNACAAFIRSASGYRYTMYFPAGRYKTGKIDITGVYSIEGTNGKTTLTGLQGQDILYWKGFNEIGYIALNTLFISQLTLNVDDSADVSGIYTRIGFGGEIVGNVAIHLPPGIRPVLKDVIMGSFGGPGSGPGNRAGGFFASGAQYALTLDGVNNWAGLDYPFVVGTSETYTEVLPLRVTLDPVTGIFTGNNTYTTGYRLAMIYDINDGSFTNFEPRKLYFVVNPTSTTFQLALTAGGAPITGVVTGTPTVIVVPAGSDSIEYANDEWAWTQLRLTGKRVSFSVANLCESAIGHFVMQSNGVSARILNFPSANRQYSVHTHMQLLDTEGPAYIATLTDKEYCRIEGEYLQFEAGPYLAASTTNCYCTIGANNSFFGGIIVGNTGTSTPANYISITGNNNDILVKADNNETNVVDKGIGNKTSFTQRPSGDATKVAKSYGRTVVNRTMNGVWPDYLRNNNPLAPYRSDNVLFYPAIQQRYTITGISLLFDDPDLDVNGYLRKAASGQVTIVNPLGSNGNVFSIGKFFPKGKWRLYAKVRSLTTTQNFTLGFQVLVGTGSAGTSVTSVGTSWQIIQLDLDHTTATDNLTGQFYVSTSTEGYDIAYWYIAPYEGEVLVSNKIRLGNIQIISGTGSPETVQTAPIGSMFLRSDGGTGTTLYIKESGTGNTGWIAK